MAVNAVSTWVGALSLDEFATFDQYGVEETNPVFPYMIKFTPNTALSTLAYDNSDLTVFEYLQRIPEGTVLYTVQA